MASWSTRSPRAYRPMYLDKVFLKVFFKARPQKGLSPPLGTHRLSHPRVGLSIPPAVRLSVPSTGGERISSDPISRDTPLPAEASLGHIAFGSFTGLTDEGHEDPEAGDIPPSLPDFPSPSPDGDGAQGEGEAGPPPAQEPTDFVATGLITQTPQWMITHLDSLPYWRATSRYANAG